MTTKEKIIHHAIELFAQKGYTETSVKEIAALCDIKAASIYNHFESKTEILDYILQEYIDYTAKNVMERDQFSKRALEEDPKELMMSMFYKYGEDNSQKFANILKIILHEQFRNERIGNFFKEHFVKYNEDSLDLLLLALIESGRIKPVNHRYYAKILNNIVLAKSVEYCHLSENEDYSDQITMDELLGFIFDLILKDEGLESGAPERSNRFWIRQGKDDEREA